MILPILLSAAAEMDLEAAGQWYEETARAGPRFVAQVQVALERIGEMPELQAFVFRDVRKTQVPKYPYYVYYRVLDDRIEVLAVVHGRRNPSVWRSRV